MVLFGKAALGHLLKNRVYLGELDHKGRRFKGEDEGIIDPGEFNQVQTMLRENAASSPIDRIGSAALLTDLIFDEKVNRA